MKVVVFALFFASVSASYIENNETSTTPSYLHPKKIYRPDSSSCMRFHQAIKKNLAECRREHILYEYMYCGFDCDGSELRFLDCHRHSNETLDYPMCDDLVCRDADSPDFPGAYCNELPKREHME